MNTPARDIFYGWIWGFLRWSQKPIFGLIFVWHKANRAHNGDHHSQLLNLRSQTVTSNLQTFCLRVEICSLLETEIRGRVKFRCNAAVRRIANCPELESDPNFFASAGRNFTRPPALTWKLPFHPAGWEGLGVSGETNQLAQLQNTINNIAS